MGSYVCRGFGGVTNYNESFARTQTMSFDRHRRPATIGVTPKWTLNSKWISDYDLPFYEAIYVSPRLVLYDTENDKAYNVIVTDSSYAEKIWKNEKKISKLTLQLELDKT